METTKFDQEIVEKVILEAKNVLYDHFKISHDTINKLEKQGEKNFLECVCSKILNELNELSETERSKFIQRYATFQSFIFLYYLYMIQKRYVSKLDDIIKKFRDIIPTLINSDIDQWERFDYTYRTMWGS